MGGGVGEPCRVGGVWSYSQAAYRGTFPTGLYTVQCTMYYTSLQCTVHCTPYSVLYTGTYNVHCAGTVHYTIKDWYSLIMAHND